MLRALRIAFSITSGILCLLFVALWVRSYRWGDDFRWGITTGAGYQLISLKGEQCICRHDTDLGWSHGLAAADEWTPMSGRGFAKFLVFRYQFVGIKPNGVKLIVVPYWCTVGLVAACAVAPWLGWFTLRYSLRMLLVVMTLVSVELAVIVCAIR